MAPRDEILAAVAAEQPAIEQLLIDLVQASTLLVDERAGQEIMRAAFADLGLEAREVPLDPEALRTHPGASSPAGHVGIAAVRRAARRRVAVRSRRRRHEGGAGGDRRRRRRVAPA